MKRVKPGPLTTEVDEPAAAIEARAKMFGISVERAQILQTAIRYPVAETWMVKDGRLRCHMHDDSDWCDCLAQVVGGAHDARRVDFTAEQVLAFQPTYIDIPVQPTQDFWQTVQLMPYQKENGFREVRMAHNVDPVMWEDLGMLFPGEFLLSLRLMYLAWLESRLGPELYCTSRVHRDALASKGSPVLSLDPYVNNLKDLHDLATRKVCSTCWAFLDSSIDAPVL